MPSQAYRCAPWVRTIRDILSRVTDLASGSILAVDDDEAILAWLKAKLARRGIDLVCCRTGAEALSFIESNPVDVVLTDLGMIGMDGIELCHRVVTRHPELPVVLLTAHGTVEAAQAAIRAGAFDFIVKPLHDEPLFFAIERAIRHRRLHEEVSRLRIEIDHEAKFADILGSSPAMRRVYGLLDRVADINTTVLITGESGTGKELVARALHGRSRRRDAPFVAVNCAALPEPLLEAELFGHAKGAFTGAQSARGGLFVSASGGTVFLDEIGELPLALQPKLLRALQERRVRPVGADREVPVEARVVAATNRDLETAVDKGAFRADLFFRLNVLPIDLPPLRARGRDVLVLAQAFVKRFANELDKPVTGFDDALAHCLMAYDWPGNVRELQNAIERAVALARGAHLAAEDLPEKIQRCRVLLPRQAAGGAVELATLAAVERDHILRVLAAARAGKAEAARILGISRKTLYRKLVDYGVVEKDRAAPEPW